MQRCAMTSKRLKLVTFQRRWDSSTSYHCCVPMCSASARFNSVLSFHTFPKDDELRRRWVVNIRRDNFTITKHTRVCSRHFQSRDLIQPLNPIGRRRLKHGAVPVLFEWNGFTSPAPQPRVDERPNPDTPENKDSPVVIDHQDHDYCSAAEPAALNHTEDLPAKRTSFQTQMEQMAINNKFGLERFAASDDNIRFYTR